MTSVNPDRALLQTGPALEFHYRFLLWLVPTLERVRLLPRLFRALTSTRVVRPCIELR